MPGRLVQYNRSRRGLGVATRSLGRIGPTRYLAGVGGAAVDMVYLRAALVPIVIVAGLFALAFVYFLVTPGRSGPPPAKPAPAACADLQCVGDKYAIRAGFYCATHVENLGSYSHRWTDGILESKFPAFQWRDRGAGLIRYHGQAIEFLQSSDGAWEKHRYWCDFDTRSGEPIQVGAERISPP